MRAMVATLKNSLYICAVKSETRHGVAAESSVFCVTSLLANHFRVHVWGNGDVPRVSAFLNLTAHGAILFMSKIKNV